MSGTPPAIYLDYQSTTPTDPRVVEAMLPFFTERFGNPHSTSHGFGRDAAEAVETARAEIAAPLGADPREIVFTSGATEANNLAIKGAARFIATYGRLDRRHLVTLATEHKCVLESCRDLTAEGFRLTVLPVDGAGLVDLDRLAAAITPDTALVSIMAAHNEIGVLQPLAEIGALCRRHGVLFHTDAAQAYGKIPLDVDAMAIDLMSISGHKIYAPKGIGALYVRRRPRVRLTPLFSGGGQERGARSGTLSPALSVALGMAARLATAEQAAEAATIRALADRFLARLTALLPGVSVNGDRLRRLPGNLNIAIEGVDAGELMAAMPEVAVSTGSACTSAEVEPSYVLTAIGLDAARAATSLRIGFGRFTTTDEVDRAVAAIAAAAPRLRADLDQVGVAAQ
ncbi:MAG TPA: aminotransferase class V-fold PLP-dependent enzyme [Stellaceae bacterium]|nr:aminotransferase class V-fold PLP-dependent enzyme [Stellaceae bacterium]